MYLCPGNGSYLESSLPLYQYAGSASGPYQSKTAATSGCALHIILCTYRRPGFNCVVKQLRFWLFKVDAWMDAHIM